MADEDVEYYQRHRGDLEECGDPLPARTEARRLASMISVRFTPQEAAQVREAAARAGTSVSNFIRRTVLAAGSRGEQCGPNLVVIGGTDQVATTRATPSGLGDRSTSRTVVYWSLVHTEPVSAR